MMYDNIKIDVSYFFKFIGNEDLRAKRFSIVRETKSVKF